MIVQQFLFSSSPLISNKLQALAFHMSPLAFEFTSTEMKATSCLGGVSSGSLQTQANINSCRSDTNLNYPLQQTQTSVLLHNRS